MSYTSTKHLFDLAKSYADKFGGCKKVSVGSIITRDGTILSIGANKCIPDLCKYRGCLRVEKYGDDSKSHRNPEDCRAIHSEIDAICSAAKAGVSVDGATISVTRYPCEACAKAIIAAGIKTVLYGGTTKVSETTKEMFDSNGVSCLFIDWEEDLSDR